MSIPVPLPRIAAFEKLGFGLFVHWGLYSQLGQGEWNMSIHHLDRNEYEKLQQTFTAEDFDAEELARIARSAGIKYITVANKMSNNILSPSFAIMGTPLRLITAATIIIVTVNTESFFPSIFPPLFSFFYRIAVLFQRKQRPPTFSAVIITITPFYPEVKLKF